VTPIAYTGFHPTTHYYGLAWLGGRNLALIGVELAPDAFGLVIFGLWIGVTKDV